MSAALARSYTSGATLAKSMPARPEVPVQNGRRQLFSGENQRMNARPQVREILIARKLQRWSLIARHKFIEPSFSRARARKNYWRLFHRYRDIAERIGLHEWSVY